MILIRGGGDIASGTIYKLVKCGYSVLILETDKPSAIRRNVAFSEAVYQQRQTIEGITCYYAKNVNQAKKMLDEGKLVILVDSNANCIQEFECEALIDAILAKKNLGTSKMMASLTIALGPGFEAGKDVDVVIETMRGHQLGKVIENGKAIENTGIPGNIGGYTKERVIHSPSAGIFHAICEITEMVKKGQVIAKIENKDEMIPVVATMDGLLRGMIHDGFIVSKGFKIADIDPRTDEIENCFTISDKARCIAGGVLEALLKYGIYPERKIK